MPPDKDAAALTVSEEFQPNPAQNLTREDAVVKLIEHAGIRFRRSGRHYRVQAVWRGGEGFNVSIDPYTGRWTDFAASERGDLADLASRLGGTLDLALS